MNNTDVDNKSCDSDIYAVHNAAIGDLSNDKVKFCRTCKARGWPNEAISFRSINDGRLKTDYTYEFKTFQILNYVDDKPHNHKPWRSIQ